MDPIPLLADEAFARRIAFGLLRDREAAEDLVQDVWVEILSKPPRHGSSPRGYLATLLRRFWLRKRRSDTRRGARERDSVPEHELHGTPALVARAEIHQRTVAATLALEEPYRSTVLLRFFDDLTPEEIAAREHIPAETVRTRLKRALDMLRARLEREGRDWREEWAVALGLERATAPLPRAATSPMRWASALAFVAMVMVGVAWLVRDGARSETRVVEPTEVVVAPPASVDSAELARVALPSDPVVEAPIATPSPRRMLHGRVVDEVGHPLSDVRMELAIEAFNRIPPLDHAVSDSQGIFALSLEGWAAVPETTRAQARLLLTSWRAGRQPHQRFVEIGVDGMPGDVELVLQPGRVAFARVVDAKGAPAAQVRVMCTVVGDTASPSPHPVGAITDREGWVGIGIAPGERVTELVLFNVERGFAYRGEHELPARTSGDVDLGTIGLQEGVLLRGRCLYPDGAPARALSLETRLVDPAPGGGFRPVDEGPRSELAGGVTKLLVYTDDLGRFEFRGLRDGLYQLIADRTPISEGQAWRSGGPDVEGVFVRHRLLVQVSGPEGKGLDETPIALTHLTADGKPRTESFHAMTGDERRPRSMNVDGGDSVAVLALAPGCASVEEIVPIPELPYEMSVRLELARADRRATLILRPSRASDGWRVDLCAPISGTPLPGLQDLVPDAEGRLQGLPLGRYQVRIEPLPPAEAGTVVRDFASPAIASVTLEAGETPLSFAVVPAARLRVAFGGPGTAGETRTSIDLERLDGVGTDRWSWLASAMRSARGGVEIHALGPDGAQPLRRVFGLGPRAGQYFDLVVPSGALRLRLALDGRAPIERELAPAPGETLEVAIPLDETVSPR